MTKKYMTPKAARRIQSNADKTGENQDFKARAQRATSKNKEKKLLIKRNTTYLEWGNKCKTLT